MDINQQNMLHLNKYLYRLLCRIYILEYHVDRGAKTTKFHKAFWGWLIKQKNLLERAWFTVGIRFICNIGILT